MCLGWAKWSSRWLSYSSCFTALVTVTLTASRQRWKLKIKNWRRAIPAPAPAVTCICCVTLSKSFYLADYRFSHLKSWDDSKSSINYLAIFCVFIPFLFEIRSQTQEASTEIKTAALRRPHTSRPHLASNSSLLLVSMHFFPSDCSQACMFMDHQCCLCSSQTEQLKQESLAHLLSGPSQREFNRPRFEPKRTRINFDPYFDISLLSSPLALAPVFSPFEEEKKQAEEAVASEHLGFPWEGRTHGLRWKDQAARHKLLGQENRGLYDPFISPFSSLLPTCRFWQLQPWSQKRTWLWLGGTAGWSSDSPWLWLGYTAFKLCFWSVRKIWKRGSKHLVSMSKKKCDEINAINGKKRAVTFLKDTVYCLRAVSWVEE